MCESSIPINCNRMIHKLLRRYVSTIRIYYVLLLACAFAQSQLSVDKDFEALLAKNLTLRDYVSLRKENAQLLEHLSNHDQQEVTVGCPNTTEEDGTKFVDTTPRKAPVYDKSGQVTAYEDQHEFNRSSLCGTIRFRIIECACRSSEGVPSSGCSHMGQKNMSILSNFTAELLGSEAKKMLAGKQKLCADAVEVISDVYSTGNGSYTEGRSKTGKEVFKATAKKTKLATIQDVRAMKIGEQIVINGARCSRCELPCQDTISYGQPENYCSHKIKKGGKCQHIHFGKRVCKKTCGHCKPEDDAKKDNLCAAPGGDWASRKLDHTRWLTSKRHHDALDVSSPSLTAEERQNNNNTRKLLEEELERQVNKLKETSEQASSQQISRFPSTFGMIKFFDGDLAGTGKPNCCPNACGSSTELGTKPFMWDQDALEPFKENEYNWTYPRSKDSKHTFADRLQMRLRTYKTGDVAYPAGCVIPEQGIPAGAHLLRLEPCGVSGLAVTVCMIVKIEVGGDPLVVGHGDILPTITPVFQGKMVQLLAMTMTCRDPNGFDPRNTNNKGRLQVACFKKMALKLLTPGDECMGSPENPGLLSKNNAKIVCRKQDLAERLRANIDGIIRTAVANVRFLLADSLLKKKQLKSQGQQPASSSKLKSEASGNH